MVQRLNEQYRGFFRWTRHISSFTTVNAKILRRLTQEEEEEEEEKKLRSMKQRSAPSCNDGIRRWRARIGC
jgi:hypothetical protein